jgi:hypothetical protein
MSNNGEYTNLEQLLNRILIISKENDTVFLDDILNVAGQKSFGTILLLTGIITLAPLIGDIPGVPTTMGLIVFLIAIQLLARREKLWLPEFLLKRSVKQKKLQKAIKWLLPTARFIDRFLKPRLTILTGDVMIHVIAMICIGIAIVMPIMEFVPFSANIAGIALTTFGLSLLARDGLLALIAYFTTGLIVVFIVYRFI